MTNLNPLERQLHDALDAIVKFWNQSDRRRAAHSILELWQRAEAALAAAQKKMDGGAP